MTSSPQIRPESIDDLPAVRRVIEAAFGEEGIKVSAIWAELVETDPAHHGFVATMGEQIVGHVGLSHAWLDARPRLIDITVLSPLGVLPDVQRGGIGTALLSAAVDSARHRAPFLVLEGDPGYYGARGFRPAADLGITPASDRTPHPAFQAVVGEGHEEWMRGRVIYPDVWWRHDAAGLRDPDLSEIERMLGITYPHDPKIDDRLPLSGGELVEPNS